MLFLSAPPDGPVADKDTAQAVTAPVRFPRFFVTSPSPCPYLPGKSERKVFTELKGNDGAAEIARLWTVVGS